MVLIQCRYIISIINRRLIAKRLIIVSLLIRTCLLASLFNQPPTAPHQLKDTHVIVVANEDRPKEPQGRAAFLVADLMTLESGGVGVGVGRTP